MRLSYFHCLKIVEMVNFYFFSVPLTVATSTKKVTVKIAVTATTCF